MSKKIEIFESAMCCPTGLCGPSIDPEILRISTVVGTLEKQVDIKRYNLTNNTKEFISNKIINDLLAKEGENILPVTIVDGVIEKKGTYPTNEEFTKWTGIIIVGTKPHITLKKTDSCCGGKGCC